MQRELLSLNRTIITYDGGINIGPLSFDALEGEMLCIVGPNGSGKSTILKAIAGHVKASSGIIKILGQDFHAGFKIPLETRRRIGFLFQQHSFYNDLPFSVYDIVSFGIINSRKNWFSRPGKNRVIDNALDIMGLQGYSDRLYKELSGGERQKVQLARLIAQQSDILLLDEPASSLDLDYKGRLLKYIGMINRDLKKTVIMVTHYIDEVPPETAKIILLKDGNILKKGYPGDIINDADLSELYSCPVAVFRKDSRVYAVRK